VPAEVLVGDINIWFYFWD